MLPKSRRLSSGQLDRIFKSPHRFLISRDDGLLIRFVQLKEDTIPSRFAFVVPSKVARFSVARHLIKRRALAALVKLSDNVSPGFLIAGWCRPAGLRFSVAQWELSWRDCLTTGDLLNY